MENTPSVLSPLEAIRTVYIDALRLSEDDHCISDVLSCAYLCNVVSQTSEPVWLQIIGPPSSHKTESLRPILTYPDTVPLSSITDNALISGFRDTEGNDPSLILRLNNRNLVIKDMTTLHAMAKNSRDKVYSDLRDAFDGSCSKASGTAGISSYKAKFGVICAVTEIVDAFSKESQQLGERFLSFRTFRYLPTHRDACSYLNHVIEAAKTKDLWRTKMTQTVHSCFNQIKQSFIHGGWIEPTAEFRSQLVILAHLLAQFRTSPINNTPVTGEMASRVVQQLMNLGSMRAIADNRTIWNHDDLSMVKRVVIDTLPVQRRRLLTVLYHSESVAPPAMATEQIARLSRMNQGEVNDLMAQYLYTGLVEAHSQGDNTYKYKLTSETRSLLHEVGLFHVGAHLPGVWKGSVPNAQAAR